MDHLVFIEGWLRERFPLHPHVYFGLSGATLLHDALKTQPRNTFVLPAYICPSLSAMGVACGKRVLHADADRHAMLPDLDRTRSVLQQADAAGTVLLADHSFGYQFEHLAELRRSFPGLLIVEDYARAMGLGGMCESSDWVLISMYKTVRGSRSGGVLLTREPVDMGAGGDRARTSIRERAAGWAPARWAHYWIAGRRTSFEKRPLGDSPEWDPRRGLPGKLCAARFARELRDLDQNARARREVAAELSDQLARVEGIEPVASPRHWAGNYVSFTVSRASRDRAITRLYRAGLHAIRIWDIVPGDYACLKQTFLDAPSVSLLFARSMAHLRIEFFMNARTRKRLIPALREALR